MGCKFMSLFFSGSCGSPKLGARLYLAIFKFRNFSKIHLAQPAKAERHNWISESCYHFNAE